MNKCNLTLALSLLVAGSAYAVEPPSTITPSIEAPQSVPPSVAPKSAATAPAPEVGSFDSPLKSVEGLHALAAIGNSYGHFAANLGCSRFAWGTISQDGSEFTLKYLPPGESMTDWKRMVLVTVHALTGDRAKDAQAISRAISETEGQYIKFAHVTNDENYPGPNNERTMFLQYTLGKIDAAAVYMRTGSSSASLIQLQERGAKIPKEDVLKLNVLANPQGTRAPSAPTKKE